MKYMRGKEELEEPDYYKVVINHEEQYSIWPLNKENPPGWIDSGKSGTKPDCLNYIKEVWTDMRPLSLRKKMEELEENRDRDKTGNSDASVSTQKDSLVSRLSSTMYPVEIYKSEEIDLKEKIGNGYIHIKFPTTAGGTVLGVQLEHGSCDLNKADFERNSGSVHLEGNLTLDYEDARCIVDIDIQTKKGTGNLRLVKQ